MSDQYWNRAIILVDMNAFFAAIEQRDCPEWRGRPLAITNGEQGSCIITCSYEARAYGIKTGMRLSEAKEKCRSLIVVPSRPKIYADVSAAIMAALTLITPDVEIFSVDEAFLDVTRCQTLYGTPDKIGLMVKQKIFEVANLRCSVGVSGDKTTAKYAAKLQKPNGFTVIPPWEVKEKLKHVRVTELCGIADGIGSFLARYGVYTCGDMQKLPISILAKRFGNIGRRIWLMCQGEDPDPVRTKINEPKSMGHGKVMPPNTRNKEDLLIYLRHMAEKLAARLRNHHLQAKEFFIGWKSYHQDWLGRKCLMPYPTNDGKIIFEAGKKTLELVWQGQAVYQVQVTAYDPQPENQQYDLFEQPNIKREKLNETIDRINLRYGEFIIAPAPLLQRSTMNNVISPAWKPYGHRQTI